MTCKAGRLPLDGGEARIGFGCGDKGSNLDFIVCAAGGYGSAQVLRSYGGLWREPCGLCRQRRWRRTEDCLGGAQLRRWCGRHRRSRSHGLRSHGCGFDRHWRPGRRGGCDDGELLIEGSWRADGRRGAEHRFGDDRFRCGRRCCRRWCRFSRGRDGIVERLEIKLGRQRGDDRQDSGWGCCGWKRRRTDFHHCDFERRRHGRFRHDHGCGGHNRRRAERRDNGRDRRRSDGPCRLDEVFTAALTTGFGGRVAFAITGRGAGRGSALRAT